MDIGVSAIRHVRDALESVNIPFRNRIFAVVPAAPPFSQKPLEEGIFDFFVTEGDEVASALDRCGFFDNTYLASTARVTAYELVNRLEDGVPSHIAIRSCFGVGRHHLLAQLERELSSFMVGVPNDAARLCSLMLELEQVLGAEFERKARLIARSMRNRRGPHSVQPADVDRITRCVAVYFPELLDARAIVEQSLGDALLNIHTLTSIRPSSNSWLSSHFIADDTRCEFRHQLMTRIEDAL